MCLVSKKHPIYVDLCTQLATQFIGQWPPRGVDSGQKCKYMKEPFTIVTVNNQNQGKSDRVFLN